MSLVGMYLAGTLLGGIYPVSMVVRAEEGGMAAGPTVTGDAVFTVESLEFFEAKVRPLLVDRCFECHSGTSDKLQGGLRLDGRDLAIRGGDSGAAIVPGKPDKSLVMQAVRWQSFEMPPQGKLKAVEIEILAKWIELGAPWPVEANSATVASDRPGYDWQRWRSEHWAFQPVTRPELPAVQRETWVQNEVDRFVLAGLEQAGLSAAPPANARHLARRIYFDLIGLPPTSEQVDTFVADAERDRLAAVGRLVDTLLESPHYGERWGRYWLDVARYSDGHGGFLDNSVYNDAWRYRDWVINAWNADRPFDEFIRMQIAGDLLGSREDAVATGFFALGPTYQSDGGDPDSIAQARAETLSDRLDTLGRGLLGLTLACARCHDHKFDPLPQQDYYSLAGVFNNTGERQLPLAPPDVVQAYDRHQQAIGELEKRIKSLQDQLKHDSREPTGDEQRQLGEWMGELAKLRETALAKYDVAHTLHDTGSADMNVAIRGNLRKPGEPAPRRFPRVLAGDDPPRFQDGSGRAQLAMAMTDPANPLTARVLVNRVWMHHFGNALVRTPSNFGALGERPTHPELLDWLTATFFESGQSIKSLHRAIMRSSTYQMSSDFDVRSFQRDGDNRLLWRMSPRRLDAEAWRDALLSVTGELDLTLGGPPTDKVDNARRTLYFKVSRNGDVFATDEFLRLFDFPLMRATIDKRVTSIVPQQYLFLLNSPFMIQRSKALAQRLAGEADTDRQRIERAYLLLFQRSPRPEEIEIGLAFLGEATAGNPQLSPWDQYAQVLLGSNEFMYVR